MTETDNNLIAIILATGNRDKVKELRPMLEELSPLVRVYSLHELGKEVEIEETEETLEGNALLKAKAIFSLLSEQFPFMIALADDTGLEVQSLHGAPGVYSARYAPMAEGRAPTYSDNDNINHLLHCMNSFLERSARFRSVIALKGILPSSSGELIVEHTTEGVVHGTITDKPRGDKGFGYDPVFLVDSIGKTYSEMSSTEKNSISHRSLAVQKALVIIKDLLAQSSISAIS